MPLSIRVDNGMPLGDPQRKLIPELALWLTAIGVEVIFNRPRQPTDNAKVERMQRTTKNWADIKSAQSEGELRDRLDKVCLLQRGKFPVSRLNNQTRLAAYPDLLENKRRYQEQSFDIDKAYQRLAEWTFVRKVSNAGQLTIYHQRYKVGPAFKKQYVSLKFLPDKQRWSIADTHGKFIREVEAVNLTPKNIQNLTVGQRAN